MTTGRPMTADRDTTRPPHVCEAITSVQAHTWAAAHRRMFDSPESVAARTALESAILAALREAREGAERERGEERRCRLTNEQEMRRADAEIGALRSERDALAARLAVQAVNLKATIFRLDRAASALLAMVSRQHHLPGSPAEWRNAIDNLRAALAPGSAPVAPRTFDEWIQTPEAEKVRLGVCKTCGHSLLPAPVAPDERCRACVHEHDEAPDMIAAEYHIPADPDCRFALAPVAPEGRTDRDALLALRQQVENTILVAQTDADEEGWITAYHFKTGAIHRLLAKAREPVPSLAAAPETPAPSGEPRECGTCDDARWVRIGENDNEPCPDCGVEPECAAAPAKETKP
jgi:hypothetical protein